MNLYNYMEDVVIDVLDILLKERDGICKCKQCKLDMTAFALNRLPPKYIVSERGFTHLYMEEINNSNWRADIVSVVTLGIDIISKRKRHDNNNAQSDKVIKKSIEKLHEKDSDVYYYNFPHLIGQVFDKSLLSPINDVKVTLFLDETIVNSSDNSWSNPYITNNVTLGFYSFWPEAIKINSKAIKSQKFNFKLLFYCDNYYSYTKEFYILVEPEKIQYSFIRRNFTEKIDDTILEKRKR